LAGQDCKKHEAGLLEFGFAKVLDLPVSMDGDQSAPKTGTNDQRIVTEEGLRWVVEQVIGAKLRS
jgi:hypothetical protein